jgi:uncharacterized membrane protein YfhO
VLLEAGGPALSGPPDPTATVEITRYEPERVDVAVRTERPAVLVLADAWFPGWTATVDGAPTPVLKADLLLRAVPVPAGSHRVGFRYRPLSVRVGAIVSLAAVGLGVGMVVAHRRKSPQ